ncbi:unnamed protein product [Protopolystoma xenopodis]|uniref:Uncharacterized protein n=1 Tax=Protopolystoma xenopodis TaxID=117903 RepID=A0A448WG61_9PLAT|nr:unnamed protein product [Protopolystoma xenopodis]
MCSLTSRLSGTQSSLPSELLNSLPAAKRPALVSLWHSAKCIDALLPSIFRQLSNLQHSYRLRNFRVGAAYGLSRQSDTIKISNNLMTLIRDQDETTSSHVNSDEAWSASGVLTFLRAVSGQEGGGPNIVLFGLALLLQLAELSARPWSPALSNGFLALALRCSSCFPEAHTASGSFYSYSASSRHNTGELPSLTDFEVSLPGLNKSSPDEACQEGTSNASKGVMPFNPPHEMHSWTCRLRNQVDHPSTALIPAPAKMSASHVKPVPTIPGILPSRVLRFIEPASLRTMASLRLVYAELRVEAFERNSRAVFGGGVDRVAWSASIPAAAAAPLPPNHRLLGKRGIQNPETNKSLGEKGGATGIELNSSKGTNHLRTG